MAPAIFIIRIPNFFLITVERLPRAAAGVRAAERKMLSQERERARLQAALETRLSAHLRRDVGIGE